MAKKKAAKKAAKKPLKKNAKRPKKKAAKRRGRGTNPPPTGTIGPGKG
jgi:hypothetical protein